jgi:endonuclease
MSSMETYRDFPEYYLAKNLSLIESGLRLFFDGGRCGIFFTTAGEFVDILAVDEEDQFVVIQYEHDEDFEGGLDKLLVTMGDVEEIWPEKSVRGVIVTNNVSQQLMDAAPEFENIEIFQYDGLEERSPPLQLHKIWG